MRFSSFLVSLSAATVALSFPEIVYGSFDALQYRQLKAAKRHADLIKRSDSIGTKRSIVLTYAEDDGYVDDTSFAARVHLSGDRETLFLEDFEHLLDGVQCVGGSMTLGFRGDVSYKGAKDACGSLRAGLVVSSHSSCSDSSAHSVFNVSDITFDDTNARIVFDVQRTTWLKAYRTRKVEFGRTLDPHHLYEHHRLAGRQDATATNNVVLAASSLVPAAGTTPTAESVSFDLNDEQTDTTFEWPEGSELGPTSPITVGCKQCTTKGQLALTQGEIDLSSLDEIVDQARSGEDLDMIKSGFFQLDLSGFESSILLKASPSGNVKFAKDLFTVPVFGFSIRGIGSAGVLFQPQLAFDIQIAGGVELNWGFKVNVPDNSIIRLDIGTFSNSSVTGFDKTTVESLPFNANAADIQLTLQAGLRPFLPIGMSFFDGDLQILGGPFMDLPFINTTITQLATSEVNANCETGKGLGSDGFKNTFKNLTHIQADIGMGVGFEFEAIVDNPLVPNVHYDYQIWSTATPLATACYAWGKETGMAVATVAEKKISGASSASFGKFGALIMVVAVFAATTVVM
ncbi:hypothetical protein P154DRAFT_582733 [Amniculicola lignicola CBS 123094]|uniref:GPI anchored protein n=1 Tax=Amniculicola lignicola CBS 123094 TaxID=1392246 RepID=A0A6A5W773_9PLEO|nr:hypothetical protein P154DRAFT_582733 [Amniculicola lignicola CBS 123094]